MRDQPSEPVERVGGGSYERLRINAEFSHEEIEAFTNDPQGFMRSFLEGQGQTVNAVNVISADGRPLTKGRLRACCEALGAAPAAGTARMAEEMCFHMETSRWIVV